VDFQSYNTILAELLALNKGEANVRPLQSGMVPPGVYLVSP
jgi:hypothetical protein